MRIRDLIFIAALLPPASLVQAGSAALGEVRFSPDVTLNFNGQAVTDENVGSDNLAGLVTLQGVGALPVNLDLSAYHLLPNGDRLLALDITTLLPGAVFAQPVDVVRFDGASFSIEFDGSDVGVPAGARIDAISVDESSNLLLSFDIAVDLPALIASDEDVVRFDGVEEFDMVFDGSAAGLLAGLDLDALHVAPENGHLFISFDTSGVAGTTPFSDEDLLEYDPVGGAWSMAYDGSAEYATWVAGDLDAAFVAFLVGFIFSDGFEDL